MNGLIVIEVFDR